MQTGTGTCSSQVKCSIFDWQSIMKDVASSRSALAVYVWFWDWQSKGVHLGKAEAAYQHRVQRKRHRNRRGLANDAKVAKHRCSLVRHIMRNCSLPLIQPRNVILFSTLGLSLSVYSVACTDSMPFVLCCLCPQRNEESQGISGRFRPALLLVYVSENKETDV